jgi:hypothetical protein
MINMHSLLLGFPLFRVMFPHRFFSESTKKDWVPDSKQKRKEASIVAQGTKSGAGPKRIEG